MAAVQQLWWLQRRCFQRLKVTAIAQVGGYRSDESFGDDSLARSGCGQWRQGWKVPAKLI